MKSKSSAEIKRDCCLFNTKYYEDIYDLYSCSMQQLVIFFKKFECRNHCARATLRCCHGKLLWYLPIAFVLLRVQQPLCLHLCLSSYLYTPNTSTS
jgi:hypothetical protein